MNRFQGRDFAPSRSVAAAATRRRRMPSGFRARPWWLAAVLLAGLQACQNPAERAAELAQEAAMLAEAGNLAAAQDRIGEAISLREDVPDFYQLRGSILLRSGDQLGAYRAYSRALEFDASNRLALAYVANLGVQVGQVSDAEDAANRLLTLDPQAVPALQVKGMIALSRNKYEEATSYAERILAIRPTDEAGVIIKARSLAKDGHPQDGIALIDAALMVAPDSAALLTNKLNIYRVLGQPEPMAAALQRLVNLTNGAPHVRLDQINLLYRQGRADLARPAAMAFLAAGSRDPADYRALERLWWEHDRAPIPEGAGRTTAGWRDPLAVLLTGRYLLLRGDLAAADALLRTAPADAQPLVASLRVRILAAQGHEQDARAQIDEILRKDSHDTDALLFRARLDLGDRRLDRAVEAAQLAQTNDPLNPEAYVVLADVYRAQGADRRARQILEDGLKRLPQNFYLLEAYMGFLHRLGDKGRAVSVARTFARNVPSSERAWSIFAAECRAVGDEACLRSAMSGLEAARTSYLVDDPPGTAPNRGLFGRI